MNHYITTAAIRQLRGMGQLYLYCSKHGLMHCKT